MNICIVNEGEISKANVKGLKLELGAIIDDTYDSIIIFEFESMNQKYIKREVLGIQKRPNDFIV